MIREAQNDQIFLKSDKKNMMQIIKWISKRLYELEKHTVLVGTYSIEMALEFLSATFK